jgi:hypothetical protein
VIAEIMAWEEETVEKITRRYVGKQAQPRRRSSDLMRPDSEQILQKFLQNSNEKSSQVLERVKGIEPSSSAWKS